MEVPFGQTPRQLAKQAATLLIANRRHQNGGRDFDNCWEMGNDNDVGRHFMELYYEDSTLRLAAEAQMGREWTEDMKRQFPPLIDSLF